MASANTTGTGGSFSAGTGAQWAGVALPLVRKVFGSLSTKEFMSVQPMNLPSGLVFFLDFQYGTEKEKDFAAITDFDGNVLQKGSHSLKERYISLGYKKTWKKEEDFYSIHLDLQHFGGKEEIVDLPLFSNIIQGPRNTIQVGIEGQRNINKTNAIRGELNVEKSTAMNYQTQDGTSVIVENLLGFNQKFSFLHQNSSGLWSIFFHRNKANGTYGSKGDKVTIRKINLGLGYTKDFSL